MTVDEAVRRAKERLKHVPDVDVDAAWIVCFAAGISRGELRPQAQKELTAAQENTLESVLTRRAAREPLQYIFGTVPFLNIELKTDARALIPRDETALVAEEAIRLIGEKHCRTMLDLGTGSGAIALACKKNVPELDVTASDISEDALSLARENDARLRAGVLFVHSDLFENIPRKFDLICSNPPYIPTKEIDKLEKELFFEPRAALDGGADGLDFYRDIIAEARAHLNPGGALVFEIGFDQGDALRALLARAGFLHIRIRRDYANLDRIVTAVNEEEV